MAEVHERLAPPPEVTRVDETRRATTALHLGLEIGGAGRAATAQPADSLAAPLARIKSKPQTQAARP